MTDTADALSPLDEAGVSALVEEALAAIAGAADLPALKEVRLAYTGDASALTRAGRGIGALDKADRPAAGKILGAARGRLNAALAERRGVLEVEAEAAMLATEAVDVTIPTARTATGARHPLDVLIDEVTDLFVAMGWSIAEGPELEHEWFDFDALNFDADHPARQMQDTFYVAGVEAVGSQGADGVQAQPGLVLRTHTSPVQGREMLRRGAPLYIACPGKVFRTDALDATHTPVFHQVEGLAVDRHLTMAHLKGTLGLFAQAMFGPEAGIRLRPSFFPFTEPSAEMDLWFPQKKGGAGWIEWGGCGMVNPEVLRNAGIDPGRYTGFAFGMGLERTLMLRHGIADVRDMVEGDVRFSLQFGTTGRGR